MNYDKMCFSHKFAEYMGWTCLLNTKFKLGCYHANNVYLCDKIRESCRYMFSNSLYYKCCCCMDSTKNIKYSVSFLKEQDWYTTSNILYQIQSQIVVHNSCVVHSENAYNVNFHLQRIFVINLVSNLYLRFFGRLVKCTFQ